MRASRLLSLLLLLQTRGRMTARDLADELEVSVRTVYRDVESLSAAGVPVYADRGPDGGYRLLEGYRTRLTGLTTGEAESLFLSGMPGPASQLGLGDVVAAAELKLMAALPPDLRTRAARIRERFHLDAPGWFRAPDHVPHLQAVADAVWNQQRIRVLYRRWARPQQVERVLEPIGVVLKAGTWYLIARAHRPDDPDAAPAATGTPPETTPDEAPPPDAAPRTYRVSKILTLQPLPQRFERPPGFDLAAYWDAYATRFEADSYRDQATVRLSPTGLERAPMLLPPVMARALHDNAEPPDRTGWTPVTLPVESLRHAHVEFLKLGADVEVLAPPQLRAMMTATARALADRYLP
ncbi:helix-turn-helix transcriptional regulator [Actinomadura verrucosospora]|uniref:DeoR family transcriptional regulator n=1 Tax=Actinomadura verrucosospora TaxID=46165 RepID=A0A7D3VNT7_ACTVE|nr:WYL domain-containing protein [Actinomadura verrucosospora]QKG19000.1 DeoR family transcriptional regulator [Actinomadura verrucosospora]